MSRRPVVVATVSLLAATLFWAGNYVVGAAAVAELDPLSLVFLRWAFAAIPLLVLAHLIERPKWRDVLRAWPWLIALSATGVIGYTLLLYTALQYTDAFNASLINAFNPALISVAAVLFLRERLSATAVIGIVLALVGVLIVLSRGSLDGFFDGGFGIGDVFMVGAIVAWTAYTILGRRGPRIPPITSTALQVVIAVIVLAPITVLSGGPAIPQTPSVWWALAFIVVFPSVLSYLLWNRALGVIPPARAGVFLNLITVFTAALTLVLGQPFTVAQVVGGVIVLGGVALANLQAFRAPKQEVAAPTSTEPTL
ncbi:DMT family transporter [Herbiconiux sp. CPCC 205763]|uniref:DMT family transporter n=1 Tax=Herbiconiux aconitum TaxID=2970913 RepID=A0ABT2GNX8_9MICO|nr:DMT family transporter [Herbiconiux aconitum]MCS5717878.1 DMT family transporter [Herbiconiux aconitum]